MLREDYVSTGGESGELFASYGELFDAIEARFETDAWPGRHANSPPQRTHHFRLDNVFHPIAATGRDVARQGEIRQGRQRDVVGAANSGLEHSPAPNGDALLVAKIVDLSRTGVTAHAAQLNVDDFARTQGDRGARLLKGVNAFVQTYRRRQLPLEFRVTVDVFPPERLFDHHQIESVEFLQQRPIVEVIGRICVHHQLDLGKLLAQALHLLQIFARFDLDLDALVAGVEFLLHG